MQERHRHLISICFAIVMITIMSVFVQNSVATSNSIQNDSVTISDSNIPQPISSGSTNLRIFASFYPIYNFVEKIGKDKVDVSTIVPNGVEPHDFEPTPKQIAELQNADLIFINGAGFEDWINDIENSNIVDLTRNITIENINSNPNPHLWLDPILVESMADEIYNILVSLDPDNLAYYQNNLKQFVDNLELLNSNIKNNLTNCALSDFVAFHDAFGYFAKRYGLTQHVIGGISPEMDVNPQKLSESIKLAEQLGITTIFSEDNIEPRLSNTIASEIGGKVLILSPIEMITQEEHDLGEDYFSKMYDNLNNLKIALECNN
jgi:zinc transport system substrate-binding protein